MDTVTQSVLGAAVGQALYGHRLGRRAAFWGAVGGLVPDLDMFATVAMGAWGEFLYHRGPTHSLLFGPVVAPLLGYAVWRAHDRKRRRELDLGRPIPPEHPGQPAQRRAWIGLFFWCLITHPLLDWFTTYGTQLMWPLSTHRFALNGIAIIDPAYTLILTAALVVGWRARPRLGRIAATLALCLSTGYLLAGWWLNHEAESVVRRQLDAEGVARADVRCYPTLLQVLLRRAVVVTPDEVRVGTYTFLEPGPVRWQAFTPERHPLVNDLLATPLGRVFRWFAMGKVAARVREVPGGGFEVEVDDLRYGYPGGPPDQGIWGIRGRYDGAGRPVGEVERYRRALPAGVRALLATFWRHLIGRAG